MPKHLARHIKINSALEVTFLLIRRIDTFPLYYAIPQPYGDANGIKSYRSAFYIRITTDSGLQGWGECADWLPTLQQGFQDRIIPYLIGKNANDRTKLVRTIAKWHARSASAVSMALTEIFAKSCGKSVSELWGGKQREKVPLYASFQSYSERTDWMSLSLYRIEEALKWGYTSFKVKIGGKSLDEDMKHIREVQALLQDRGKLAVDANGSYDYATVIRWLPLLAESDNLLWLEEPLPIEQTHSYSLLRHRLPLPIAGGEDMKLAADFLPLLSSHSLDILTPDLLHLRGMDEYWGTISLAHNFGTRITPHAYDGALTRLYAIMAQACLIPWSKMKPDSIDPVEWDVMDNPFTDLLPLKPINGEVTLPDGKGIGVELDVERMKAYIWDGSSYG